MKKAIIIGAGPAGLTAANELLKLGKYEVIILEETESIGGIAKTINYKGNRMDIGGHRFFSKSDTINNYWIQLLPLQGKPAYDDRIFNREKEFVLNGPDPEKCDNVMLIRRRISRILYARKFFDYPISIQLSTIKNMGLITTAKVGISYLYFCIFKRKEQSLEDFYINRFGKKLYEMFFLKYTEKVWGRTPKNISADWGEQRVKGISIIEVIKDFFHRKKKKNNKSVQTSLIEEFWYPKYGPGQLWETLANHIEEKGGKILKNYKVEKINIINGKLKSVICNHDGKEKEFEGEIFLSSMPIKDLVQNMQGEIIPKRILDIASGLPYRDFITIGLLVKKLKIQNNTKVDTLGNIVPDCWMYIQEPDVKIGRLQIFNNWSPYLVKNVEENIWLGLEYFVQDGDKYWNMSEKEFSEFAIEELVKLEIIDKEDVLDFHQEKIKKAYPAYFDTYTQMDELIKYLDSFSNLYCIGRNGQHRYNNMDHSMMTAIEAVKNIENDQRDKSNIWNVNTEKKYCEDNR
ncbi:MAG: NAD(P)/FAD-dependent oxidoreductase [Clostridia bacterium]|nr:NAD(P)/FAD-dependent oxidoreductase [Clostridia bacterium]